MNTSLYIKTGRTLQCDCKYDVNIPTLCWQYFILLVTYYLLPETIKHHRLSGNQRFSEKKIKLIFVDK